MINPQRFSFLYFLAFMLDHQYSFYFLWGFNAFHRKQTTPKYLYHSSQRQNEKKVKKVTFSDKSEILCLEQLCKLEEQFLSKYLDFSLFPSFLKSHSVIHPILVQTKFENSRFIYSNSMQLLFGCPCTSSKELDLIFNP